MYDWYDKLFLYDNSSEYDISGVWYWVGLSIWMFLLEFRLGLEVNSAGQDPKVMRLDCVA